MFPARAGNTIEDGVAIRTAAVHPLVRGDLGAVDVALLGLPVASEKTRDCESLRAVGLRALVHGHSARRGVSRGTNRWNIDTGAGIARLNRLTILHLNGRQIRPSRLPVPELS